MNVIVSDRPPHAQELVNCIDRAPVEGKHHVAIHIVNTFGIELPPGNHAWTDRDSVSEYVVSNVTFSNITYNVLEPLEHHSTFWTWLHALIFGPPDVQTVIMSFEVKKTGSRDTPEPNVSARV